MANDNGVVKIILTATYFPFKGSGLINEELLKRIRGKNLFSMFGSLDAMNHLDAGLMELHALAERGLISGIKLYPGYQDFDFGGKKAFPIYRLADRYSLPVMIHSGYLHYCCPKDAYGNVQYRCTGGCRIEDLGYLARPMRLFAAVKEFPQVTFILSHLGNPYFDELRDVMRQCSNVLTDISGLFASGGKNDNPQYKDRIKTEIDNFLRLENGIEHILFGTDFPIQSYKDSIELVKAQNLSADQESKIFFENAARVLRINEERR